MTTSRRASLAACAVGLACVVAAPASGGNADDLVTNDSMGRASLGFSELEMRQVHAASRVEDVDLRLEGDPTPALAVREGGQVVLTAETPDGRVWWWTWPV